VSDAALLDVLLMVPVCQQLTPAVTSSDQPWFAKISAPAGPLDEQLALLAGCCHPALAPEFQVGITALHATAPS
jgi:predicted RNA polymerase sigma factor|tara:strand:- start:1071 stop:1292 length:222 start_codon:yes stop_codon:yes gene_type:complete